MTPSVIGLAVPKPSSQVSAGISISCQNSTSDPNPVSGSTFVPRPLGACDRVTMAEDGPAQARVTAGVGSVSRGAETEPNSPDRWVQPTLQFGSESIFITGISSNYLLTLGNRKLGIRVIRKCYSIPQYLTEADGQNLDVKGRL